MNGVLPEGPHGTVITVGSFDGVHLGHRAVLDEIARRARAAGRRSVLVTFEPHPLMVVNPAAAPPVLTTGPERREILAQTDLDYAVFLRFDRHLAAMGPEDFVRGVLRRRYHMRELVIGHDHGFGRGRSGDVDTLRRMGESDGFAVDVVAAVGDHGFPVSSTKIRRAIAGGDLATARRLLGRPYKVSAMVTRGAGRGRQLGIPTANMDAVPAEKLLPPDGVYAVRVEWPGGRTGGMMNQGGKPTFGDGRRSLEVHLFDFEGDLYGRWISVEWVTRLRDVRSFDSAGHLARQLEMDRATARKALAAGGDRRE